MSYLRWSSKLRRVKGESDSYVYRGGDNEYIEDCDEYIPDKDLVEIIWRAIKYRFEDKNEGDIFAEWVAQRLAERLDCELRDESLTDEEVIEMWKDREDEAE